MLVFADHTGLVPMLATGQVAMFLFFGLSGFLITALLTAERATTGRICLYSFYVRRGLRLLPALIVFLLVWLLVVAMFGSSSWLSTVPNGRAGTGQSFLVAVEGAGAALGYVTNWFELLGIFPGYVAVGHLWSLAVEEQFYLCWAPALALLLRRSRRAALGGAILLAVASFADVALIQHAHSTTSWVFRSTDTRSGAFLAGAALAVWWTSHPETLQPLRRVSQPLAWMALAVLTWAGWVFAHPASFLSYNAAWIGVSLGSPALTLALVAREPGTVRLRLPSQVMSYLGRRSYALYLWHYVWLTWLRDLGLPGIALALAASLASAELSWRLVESPALRHRHRFERAPEPPLPARRSPPAAAWQPSVFTRT
jgi:peptidoglycan/LPS O-acetylase OafA/YrhL